MLTAPLKKLEQALIRLFEPVASVPKLRLKDFAFLLAFMGCWPGTLYLMHEIDKQFNDFERWPPSFGQVTVVS